MAATANTQKQQPSPQKKAEIKAAIKATVKHYRKTLELLSKT